MNLQNNCSEYKILNSFALVLEIMYGGTLDHKSFCVFIFAFKVDRVICILPVLISLHILPSLNACVQNWGENFHKQLSHFF